MFIMKTFQDTVMNFIPLVVSTACTESQNIGELHSYNFSLKVDANLWSLQHEYLFNSSFYVNKIFRQKLTSPKWNRFRGIRLRWKEKIRLNNVIWRCWHLQCKFFSVPHILERRNFFMSKNMNHFISPFCRIPVSSTRTPILCNLSF